MTGASGAGASPPRDGVGRDGGKERLGSIEMQDHYDQLRKNIIPTSSMLELLQAEMASYEERRDNLISAVRGLSGNRLAEIYRRHLEGLMLKSTYNRQRVRALRALVAKLREELKPLIEQIMAKEIALHLAEMEMQAYEDADQANFRDRQVKKDTGLYADTADFIDVLFDEHEITRDDFASLNSDDIARIAQIINESAAANVESGLYDSALKFAKNF